MPLALLLVTFGTITASAAHYTVKPGDNLWTIARGFRVDVGSLARDNRITNPNFIYPGQNLTVRDPPAPAPFAAAPRGQFATSFSPKT